mgnify:FL=1
MADLKSIFNQAKKENHKKEAELYDWQKPAYKKDDVGNLNRLLKNLSRNKSAVRHKGSAGTFSGGNSRVKSEGSELSKRQRVTFKMSVGHSEDAHKKYLRVYMPQTEKSEVEEKPDFFGTDFNEYEANLDKDHFKCIISPESQNVDLRLLAAKFIERMENITGYRLCWQGCIHSNTAHRHAHLAINGTDKNGRKVYFAKEMIKTTMREVLSEMATAMVGERTYTEIQAAKDRLPESARWTSLDERLSVFGEKIFARNLDMSLQNRLAYLTTIKLAERSGGFYRLNPDWKEVLQASGRFNSFLDEFLVEKDLPLRLFEGGSVYGVVEKTISFDKDESWNDALIVRTDKERIYVPVYQLHKENLEGKTVVISATSGGLNRQVSDRNIRVMKNHSLDIER